MEYTPAPVGLTVRVSTDGAGVYTRCRRLYTTHEAFAADTYAQNYVGL